MGLFDFAKDMGKKLFGKDDDPAEKIHENIAAANPGVDGLDVQYEDGVVRLGGQAESAEANYPFLIACVFFSSGSWVTGLSSSIPLVLNTAGNFLIEAGLLPTTIPTSETLGSSLNLTVIAVYLVVGPAIMYFFRPRGAAIEIDELRIDSNAAGETTVAEDADALRASQPNPSDRLNNSSILQLFVVVMGLAYIVLYFTRRGFDLNLNIMIFSFLIFGMLLHRTPIRYVVAMGRACSNISGIVFQYPFYAGIMGIMLATGLGRAIAVWMASLVTLKTLPVAAFFLGGVGD